MKKHIKSTGLFLIVLLAALMISGCGSSPHESIKDAVELSVGDIVVFGNIRWYHSLGVRPAIGVRYSGFQKIKYQ